MASDVAVSDPNLRIAILGAWVRKERRLVAAIVVVILVVAGAWFYAGSVTEPFTPKELVNLSRLPVAPEGSAIVPAPEAGFSQEELDALERLREQARNLPRPDLVDAGD